MQSSDRFTVALQKKAKKEKIISIRKTLLLLTQIAPKQEAKSK